MKLRRVTAVSIMISSLVLSAACGSGGESSQKSDKLEGRGPITLACDVGCTPDRILRAVRNRLELV